MLEQQVHQLQKQNQQLSLIINNLSKMSEVTKDTLFNKVKECKQIIINDSVYFGTITKEKEGYSVKGIRSEGSVERDVKAYLKADNMNKLETLSLFWVRVP